MKTHDGFGAALTTLLVIVLLFFGLGTLVSVTPARASVVWTGTGATGGDPFGQSWQVGFGGWGLPGITNGDVPWAGSDWISGFNITFGGLEIDPNGTVMRSAEAGIDCCNILWDRLLVGSDTVWFAAPTGVQLDPGDEFFVNVAFTSGTPSAVDFTAEYTTDRIPGRIPTAGTIPEPAPLALFSLGLAGLGVIRHRGKKA